MTHGSTRTFAAILLGSTLATNAQDIPNLFPYPNSSGFGETYNNTGTPISTAGPFFQSLGTNGRSCFSCHRPAEGWTITPEGLKLRFALTQGRDPVFAVVDGANCNNIDPVTLADPKQHSLLLTHGLIRIEIALPANAEFEVIGVDNPYGCASQTALSVYRRPLPTTNLRPLSAVMWDGRESAPQTGTQKITYATNPADLNSDLQHQSMDAVNIHAQASTPISADLQSQIAQFEMALSTAQAYDYAAGSLDSDGATGGPLTIAKQIIPSFFVGINDPLGGNPKNIPFTPVIFNLFDSWINPGHSAPWWLPHATEQRASILRGQQVFNSKQINIVNVAGLNDDLNQPLIVGNCGTCHDSLNIGSHSLPVPLNIGVGDLNSPLDVSYLPVFTLQNKTTLEIQKTTDPGRALITGAWKDVGRLKGPVLRGLASRAPYFHNGSARSLSDVVDFYNQRFNVGFTAQEKSDLIAFLNSL